MARPALTSTRDASAVIPFTWRLRDEQHAQAVFDGATVGVFLPSTYTQHELSSIMTPISFARFLLFDVVTGRLQGEHLCAKKLDGAVACAPITDSGYVSCAALHACLGIRPPLSHVPCARLCVCVCVFAAELLPCGW